MLQTCLVYDSYDYELRASSLDFYPKWKMAQQTKIPFYRCQLNLTSILIKKDAPWSLFSENFQHGSDVSKKRKVEHQAPEFKKTPATKNSSQKTCFLRSGPVEVVDSCER